MCHLVSPPVCKIGLFAHIISGQGSNLPLLLFITLSTLYRYHPRCFAIILASQDLTILLMNAGGMGFKFYLEITVATLYCCTARQHWAIFHRHGLRVFFWLVVLVCITNTLYL
jgi:hypothetical protein